MENIIGKAIDFLREKGIDTSNMTMEEIIAKYNELMASESEVVEAEDNVEREEVKEEIAEEEAEDVEEESDVDALIRENQDIIDTFTDEQKMFFEKLLKIIR